MLDRIEKRGMFEDWKSFFRRLFHRIKLKLSDMSEARAEAFNIYSNPELSEGLLISFLEEIKKAQDENRPLYEWSKSPGWPEFKAIVEDLAKEAAIYCSQVVVDERVRRDNAVIVNCLGRLIAAVEGRAEDFRLNAFIRKIFNEASYNLNKQ